MQQAQCFVWDPNGSDFSSEIAKGEDNSHPLQCQNFPVTVLEESSPTQSPSGRADQNQRQRFTEVGAQGSSQYQVMDKD